MSAISSGDWVIPLLSGVLGAIAGGAAVLAVATRALRGISEEHRAALGRQNESLRASVLGDLHSQVSDVRAKAQARLLGGIYRYLSNTCLPLYGNGQEIAAGWRERLSADGRDALLAAVEGLQERTEVALDGYIGLLDEHRHHDDIYWRFRVPDEARDAWVEPISALARTLRSLQAGSPDDQASGLEEAVGAFGAAVEAFGKWIKEGVHESIARQRELQGDPLDLEI